MADQQPAFLEPRDTSPLRLEQLSDNELATIIQVERRLYEAQRSAAGEKPSKEPKDYLAPPQVRHPRVLLLDGGRGTGKTSMLLTLLQRWTNSNDAGVPRHDVNRSAYRKRVSRIRSDPHFTKGDRDFDVPTHVHVIGRILDFDPLPSEMPLIAGIMQAWQPLARQFDELGGRRDDCETEGESLLDLWHRLFRVAAVGWTAIPQNRGLIEQVLDRQEQVADWQRLDERWREFVDEVIARGKCLPGVHRFSAEPVFVIMIDDVDLQVERIRELLPALRLLYHRNVVFLVAADKGHMIHMLKLDFVGQQNKLADAQTHADACSRWASHLAYSSFEKVFPLRNQWTLRQLSLLKLLEFPREIDNLKAVFNRWHHRDRLDLPLLGDYLYDLARIAEEVVELPPIMSYRTAHQVFDQVSARNISDTDVIRAVARLIGVNGSDDLVRVTERRGREGTIDYLLIGELAAIFRQELTYPSEKADIVLSARPDFVYRREPSSDPISMTGERRELVNFTSAMVAVTLREDGYGVNASGLRWDVRLALVWSRLRVLDRKYEYPSLDLAFQWRFHEHPSPMRLLSWAADWGSFLKSLHVNTEYWLDRIAYAWIFHQLRWLGVDMKDVLDPFHESFNSEDSWTRLLECDPGRASEKERARWRTQTLPLLARPEIGLTPIVQERLLTFANGEAEQKLLWDQRRRLVTDAIIAANDEIGGTTKDAEDHVQVERMISVFERRHGDAYLQSSPWWKAIEQPVLAKRDTDGALPFEKP